MQKVITDWEPRNSITTPLPGMPKFINSGIIKAVMSTGDKISVGQIDYQEFDEENFQYVISPYWDIIDGLPAKVFQGIPGIDMDLRLKNYYRVNYIPTFITERTPSENREDLWELLESVGLDYYDRFEWLIRTPLRAGNDNLIVERRRNTVESCDYSAAVASNLQYGDRVIVDDFIRIADTSCALLENWFDIVTSGIDIIDRNGQILVDSTSRTALIYCLIAQKLLKQKEDIQNRQRGIDKAKSEGKYQGRKPIDVDENTLRQVAWELEQKIITVKEAMQRTNIKSRSTFYRKLRGLTKLS